MEKKRMLCVAFVALCLVTSASLTLLPRKAALAAEKYGGITDIRVLDGESGSPGFLQYSVHAASISEIPGLRATCMAGAFVGPNVMMLENNEGEFASSSEVVHWYLAEGTGPFKGQKFNNIAFLSHEAGYRPFLIAVRADSDIYTIDDLRDKRICTSRKGSVTTTCWLSILESVGITPMSLAKRGGTMSFIGTGGCINGLRDKTIDAHLSSCSIYGPHNSHVPLDETIGLRLIPIGEENARNFSEEHPKFHVAKIPAGHYKNLTKDYITLHIGPLTTICRKNLPDDLVYDVLKMMYSKKWRRELYEANKFTTSFVLENGLQGSYGLPVHPGAAKFYKDHGVKKGAEYIVPISKEDAVNSYGGQW